MQERLQKIIARAGKGSRRANEELITAGRVRVNGKVITELGSKADPRNDVIEVDGQRIVAELLHYVVLHKPRGVVSTLSDPEGRPTVAESLKGVGARVHPVGRLDFATSGVLLATNDGEFTNGLLHPRGGVPKIYVVKVNGEMQEADIARWETGVQLADGMTLPTHMHFLRHEDGKTWFEVTLREGRNQQIRRMGEATGFPVMRLARTSFAGVTSEGLRPGEWRPLNVEELTDIREHFGVPRRVRGAVTRAPEHKPERRERGGDKPERPARNAGRRGERVARSLEEREPPPRRGARPAASTDRPARPGERRARPAGEATERGQRPARPTERGARPAAGPGERGQRPTRPGERGARPAAGPPERSDRQARPGDRGASRRNAGPPERTERVDRPGERRAPPNRSAAPERAPERRGPPSRSAAPERAPARRAPRPDAPPSRSTAPARPRRK
jgi:23S rRNA pseudouridine2605 synthase